MKNIVFRHYLPIALAICVGAIVVGFQVQQPINWKLIVTIVGGILSSIYFVQKQRLEELRLFKELFTEFNERYDRLNEGLNQIREDNVQEELTQEEIKILYDYFNLCGKEYFYYKQGYVLSKVWKAWLNGTKIFYENRRIRELWERELKTNSYYGFKLRF